MPKDDDWMRLAISKVRSDEGGNCHKETKVVTVTPRPHSIPTDSIAALVML